MPHHDKTISTGPMKCHSLADHVTLPHGPICIDTTVSPHLPAELLLICWDIQSTVECIQLHQPTPLIILLLQPPQGVPSSKGLSHWIYFSPCLRGLFEQLKMILELTGNVSDVMQFPDALNHCHFLSVCLP